MGENTPVATALVGPLGLPGVALAIALAAWLEAATLLGLLRRRLGPLGLTAVASVGLRTTVATGVAAVAALVVHDRLGGALSPDPGAGGLAGVPGLVLTMAVVAGAFGASFIVAALALRIEELRSIVGIMVDALRRPRRS